MQLMQLMVNNTSIGAIELHWSAYKNFHESPDCLLKLLFAACLAKRKVVGANTSSCLSSMANQTQARQRGAR